MPRRFAAVAFMVLVLCLTVGTAASPADSHKPGSGGFAEFRACMKAHGAPALTHHRLSEADRAALKSAFAACQALLPKRGDKGHGDHPDKGQGHKFTPPTAAQVTAFKTCMAGKGFTLDKTTKRPDLHDPAVRSALRDALKACLPLLKPTAGG